MWTTNINQGNGVARSPQLRNKVPVAQASENAVAGSDMQREASANLTPGKLEVGLRHKMHLPNTNKYRDHTLPMSSIHKPRTRIKLLGTIVSHSSFYLRTTSPMHDRGQKGNVD